MAAIAAPSASASIGIESFTTTGTDPQAGGHPDLSTSFALEDPGAPEAARNVSFEAPRGIFGNPDAIARCTSVDFALQKCFPSAQAGLITIYANYEGDPKYLLGTAPIYDMEVPSSQVAQFAFIVPGLNIPINIPVSVRTADDYGLRFTVSNISQKTPLAAANLIFWGFPLEASHDSERFPKGSPGNPAGCPGLATSGCKSHAVANRSSPVDRQSDHLHRTAAGHQVGGRVLSGRRPDHRSRKHLSRDRRL
jgi:hypothetical protein